MKPGHSKQKGEKGKCLDSSASGRLGPAVETAHPDLVLKTTERGGWIRPRLAKNDDLSLTHSAGHPQQRDKKCTTERHSFPGICGSVGYYLNTCSLGYYVEGREERGAYIRTYTHRLGCLQSVDANRHLLAQLKPESLYGHICLILFAAQGTKNNHALKSLNQVG